MRAVHTCVWIATFLISSAACTQVIAAVAIQSVSQVTGGQNYTPSPAPSQGADERVVVIALTRRAVTGSSARPSLTGLSWGNRTLDSGINLIGTKSSSGSGRCAAYLWYVKKKDFPTGTSSPLQATWASEPSLQGTDEFTVYTLSGVNQVAAMENSDIETITTSSGALTLSATTRSVQIAAGCVNSSSANSEPGAPFVEQHDAAVGTAHRTFSDSAVTASAGTVNWSRNFGSTQAGAAVVGSFAKASGVAFTGTKWHPGHYVNYTGGHDLPDDVLDFFESYVANTICPAPGVVGVNLTVWWTALEDGMGNYTQGFQRVERALAALAACNKYLMLHIADRTFGNWPGPEELSAVYPSYLLASPYGECCTDTSRGAIVLRPPADTDWAGGLGTMPRTWTPVVMDRLVALARAYGAHFNDSANDNLHHANFVMMSIGETSIAAETGVDFPGWDIQLKRWYAALGAAGPRIVGRIYANYFGSDADMRGLLTFCTSVATCVVGGPDPELPLPTITRKIPANYIYRGADCSGCTIRDFRGSLGWVGEVQEFGYIKPYPRDDPNAVYDAKAHYDYQSLSQHMRFMVWLGYKRETETYQLINDFPSMGNALCPANFLGCSSN